MKNGVETLAKMFKDRENATSDFVVFGKIIELPNLKIQFTSKIILTKDHIKSLIDLYKQDIDGRYVYKGRDVVSIVNLYERDAEGRYIHNGKKVVLLPYNNDNSYIVLGVIQDG